ncbi:hypothetical protein B0H10DRAFT_2004277, partial [Mycena sp. CBHHK59/15]
MYDPLIAALEPAPLDPDSKFLLNTPLRTHCFGALIIANHCRLFRLTRSAMEVTKLFDYTTSPLLITAGGQRDSRRARELINAIGKPLWSVTVGDHSFYVSHPFTRSHHLPVGRGTRCFVAVETKTDRIFYARLKEQQVQNIPDVIVAKDVDGPHHRCGVDDYPFLWSKFKEQAIRDHQHYRLVLDVVGRPLVGFGSTHELVKCMLDALQAHCDAWTKARVEHRDVSVGNIILVGTRQFMSARLSSATEPQARELADDLESFLLVLLWLQVFDDANPAAKRRLISSGKSSVVSFNLDSPHFEHLLVKLLDGFETRYTLRPRLNPGPPISTVHLESHGWMLELLRQALEDETWRALKDAGEAQPVKWPEVTALKRKSEIPEYG